MKGLSLRWTKREREREGKSERTYAGRERTSTRGRNDGVKVNEEKGTERKSVHERVGSVRARERERVR